MVQTTWCEFAILVSIAIWAKYTIAIHNLCGFNSPRHAHLAYPWNVFRKNEINANLY